MRLPPCFTFSRLKTGFLRLLFWRLGVTLAPLVAFRVMPRPSSFLFARLYPVMLIDVSLEISLFMEMFYTFFVESFRMLFSWDASDLPSTLKD